MYRQKRNFDNTQKKNSVSRDVKNALEVIRLLRELYVHGCLNVMDTFTDIMAGGNRGGGHVPFPKFGAELEANTVPSKDLISKSLLNLRKFPKNMTFITIYVHKMF